MRCGGGGGGGGLGKIEWGGLVLVFMAWSKNFPIKPTSSGEGIHMGKIG